MVSETLWVPVMGRTSFSELRQKKDAAERAQLRVLTRFQVKTILSRIFLGRNLVRALRRQAGGPQRLRRVIRQNQQATSNQQQTNICSRTYYFFAPSSCHLPHSSNHVVVNCCNITASLQSTLSNYLPTLPDLPHPASPLFVIFSRS